MSRFEDVGSFVVLGVRGSPTISLYVQDGPTLRYVYSTFHYTFRFEGKDLEFNSRPPTREDHETSGDRGRSEHV